MASSVAKLVTASVVLALIIGIESTFAAESREPLAIASPPTDNQAVDELEATEAVDLDDFVANQTSPAASIASTPDRRLESISADLAAIAKELAKLEKFEQDKRLKLAEQTSIHQETITTKADKKKLVPVETDDKKQSKEQTRYKIITLKVPVEEPESGGIEYSVSSVGNEESESGVKETEKNPENIVDEKVAEKKVRDKVKQEENLKREASAAKHSKQASKNDKDATKKERSKRQASKGFNGKTNGKGERRKNQSKKNESAGGSKKDKSKK